MLDAPQVTLPALISVHAANHPHQVALIEGTTTLDWQRFDHETSRIAHALRQAGFGIGSNVGVLAVNSIESILLVFGVAKAGACYVPINGFLSDQQVVTLIKDAEVDILFVSTDYAARVDSSREALPRIPSGNWISVGFERAGWKSLKSFVNGCPTDPLPPVDPTSRMVLWYSSGTTGRPKAIVKSFNALQWSAILFGAEMGFRSDSIALLATPVSAAATWLNMLSALFVGGTIVVTPKFSAPGFLALVEKHRVTHAQLVPTQLDAVVQESALDKADCSSLRAVLSVGSALAARTKSEIRRRMTSNFFECYGSSEGSATLCRPMDHDKKPGSVGRALLGCEVYIIDNDDVEVEPDVIGEIVARVPFMMEGYYGRPEDTAELVWRKSDGRTFLRTGDLGSKDEEGFVFIRGRKKDMIISGGFNVYPADIEAVILEHPAVEEVAVIGIPDPKWGETPAGLVRVNQSGKIEMGELLDWVNGRLGKHQRLQSVHHWSSFPRNALGKLLKNDIRVEFLSAGQIDRDSEK
ncbi:class I adenylate-forming enzyme family protein [Mesorhizobium ciceri]|uniref:class I adenylate-forming enzyme family protein n=1 Tax=Mesorhizobium TaxID=68287 RepID=UPI0004B8835F|nr:class I adenylate-forming enzyme family protein [Mesorhizobium ciceri]